MADQEFTTEELESEEWRDIPNFVGVYQVSNLGRLRRIKPSPRYPNVPRIRLDRFSGARYRQIRLTHNGGKQLIYIHRAVLNAFGEPAPSSIHEVNHKDGNKLNNRLENLEWVTHKENSLHAGRTGLIRRGERGSAAKLTEADVRTIRRLSSEGIGASELGRRFHLNESSIRYIRDRVNWKHVN